MIFSILLIVIGLEKIFAQNNHDYVDLGLPSGTLWATCNIGANAPEEYGDYFAWGETQPKSIYNLNTLQYFNISTYTFTKYCNDSGFGYNGFTDNLTTLLPEDDAATANWGNGWRMPTKEEWEELKNNTTVNLTTMYGVYGSLFTASNGNSIFLPAAGWRNDSSLNYAGNGGIYWSSSLYTDSPAAAWGFGFYSGAYGNYMNNGYTREGGHSVRPVHSSNNVPTGAIEIGTGEATNKYLPSYNYYNYSMTEQIYTAEEIGMAGTINSIAFYNEGAVKTRTYDLYLKSTNKESFSSKTDWITMEASDKVFSGEVTMAANTWTFFTFTTPFEYDGVSNVVLTVDDNTGEYTSSPHMACSVYNTSSTQTIYIYSDGTNYNPSSPTTSQSSNYATLTMKNHLFMEITPTMGTQYEIIAEANLSEAGTISGAGIYEEGETCMLTATPSEGCSFVNWTENDEMISSEAIYTFTVTGDRILVANFSINTYEVTAVANPIEGGTITIEGGNTGVNNNNVSVDFSQQGYTNAQELDDEVINIDDNISVTLNKNNADYPPRYYNLGEAIRFYVGNSFVVSTETGSLKSITFTYGSGDGSATISANVGEFSTDTWTGTAESVTFTIGGSGGNRRIHSIDVVYGEECGLQNNVYTYGSSCTMMATANEGYTFANWTENNEVVSTEATYTFTVTGDRTLVANFTQYGGGGTLTGAINGKFSVGANQQVCFSQGNLQYQASTNTWKFAENQWDIIGSENSNISENYVGWIDLFGWGTSGWNNGNTYYHPWDSDNSSGSTYGPPGQYNLTGSYANADWGVYNPISNGGNQAGQWRTMTKAEWGYVFNTRTTASGIRYAKANVNNVNGVILLPDDWSSNTYSLRRTNISDADFSSNTITASQWSILEQAGAVFLPAAGQRFGTSVSGVDSWGSYWSALNYSSYGAYSMIINSTALNTNSYSRDEGLSVRLVCVPENYSFAINAVASPAEGGEVSGGGIYQEDAECTLTATPSADWSFVSWTENNEVVSTEATYTFMVTGGRTLVANFNPNSFKITVSANPSYAGTVIGAGTYEEGQTCTLTATPSADRSFVKWTENGQVVSHDAIYTFTVTENRTLVANFTLNGGGNVPTGAINGKFSVRADQQVYFSQGNLQYQASTNTWKFADNQYDYVGDDNSNISSSYSGWIDLFGWGTSGWNSGNTYFQPWNSADYDESNHGNLYGPYGRYNLTGRYANADWGVYNQISNGGSTTNQWRTLTKEEWQYVFNTRTTVSGIRYAKANVNNVNGTILLPDDWSNSTFSLSNTNSSDASFSSNTLTASQWSILEQTGAVFLPTAGMRNGTSVYGVGSSGNYWSVTNSDYGSASGLNFNDSYFYANSGYGRYMGQSVRLVCVYFVINAVASPAEGGEVSGGGGYPEGADCTLTATPSEGWSFLNWTENGEVVSRDATYSFTMTVDRTLVANFSMNSYEITTSTNPAYAGTIIGAGRYEQGTECTLTATPSAGRSFVNWTENGVIVSTDATYTFIVTGDRTLMANFTQNGGGNVHTGAINGLFSVSADQRVYFSQGNLQYQASTNTWKFADYQWNYLGDANSNSTSSYSGWIDLFGWGTSGYNHGANCYQPWSKSTNDSDYYAYGNSEYNLYDQTGKADWGYNPICNGGNTANQWRSLTRDEWYYVLNTRTTASGIRYAKANVNNVNGVILLPDNWSSSTYSLNSTNSSGASFSSNTLTASQWNILEQAGAVFLPAAGDRYGSSVNYVGSYGYYWLASYYNSSYACYVYFELSLSTNYRNRCNGLSVRLVRVDEYYSFGINAVASPAEGGEVSGGGAYSEGTDCMLTAMPSAGWNFVNWTENGEVVCNEASYTFTVTGDRALVANFIPNGNTPTGAINGLFSVSANQRVYFSQGDLQYQASTNTWKFADNQWDYVGDANSNISSTYSGWIDLFGWGTSGFNHGANSYQPWSTSTNNSQYYAYGNYRYNLYNQTGQADWGYNPISNGSNATNQWRSLTRDEWYYVLNTRTTASGIRYAKANVNNVNGVILLPDNWSRSTYSLNSTNTSDASFSSNILSASQWSTLEQAGAVFLPAAGSRYGTSIDYVGSSGIFWSASYNSDGSARTVSFNDSKLYPNGSGYSVFDRSGGSSVRLVRVDEYNSFGINAVASPAEGGEISGGGAYSMGADCTLTATPSAGWGFVNWTENGEVVSTEATYTFTVTGDRILVANFTQNGGGDHAYVDLGLPSGTMWATCNIGANSPEEYGDCFAWGETEPKATYSWSNYQYCNGSYNQLTKYCDNSSYGYYGYTDALAALMAEDDAATTSWGTDWRMPTLTEWQELYQNTINSWTTQNGMNGWLFTATNGNSIFLPAAGYRNGNTLYNNESSGYYWSNSLCTEDNPRSAWRVFFDASLFYNGGDDRAFGRSVRPVRPAQQQQTTQTTSLNSGWNWFSTFIEQNGDNGLTQLENSLGHNGTMIKSQTLSVDNFYSYMGYDYWYGELASLENENGYMINATTECGVTMSGVPANPADHPITIQPNWNWIGYPVSITQTLETAMASFVGTQDDVIKSQGESSTYYEGYGWFPEINLVPGIGYLYKSNATMNRTLVYDVNRDETVSEGIVGKYWSCDIHAFANNLTIIATVTVGDDEVRSGDIELGAFVGGENRGSAVLKYFEPLDSYYAVLTVTGAAGDKIDFGIVDRTSGERNFKSDSRFTFMTDAVWGTLNNPCNINFDADWTQCSNLTMFPNPVSRDNEITIELPEDETVKEIVVTDILGEQVNVNTLNVTTLSGFKSSGIYMVQVICESGNVYMNKLVVK